MSAASFMLDPILNPLLTGVILIGLTGFFLWMEYHRKTRFLTIRMLALLMMMLAVAGLLMRPLHRESASDSIILLTPGYNSLQADSLSDLYPSFNVIHTEGATPSGNSDRLKSAQDLSGKHIQFILGEGLAADSLEMFQLGGYTFLPSPYREGIIHLLMPPQMLPHRRYTIEGVYNQLSQEPTTILLKSPGGTEDSLTVFQRGAQRFALSFLTRQAGNYSFAVEVNGQVHGMFPLQVQEHRPLEILFLQRYPTFETRYLKEYLSRYHRLVIRYQLSRNTYRHQFINGTRGAVNTLTRKLLSDFDVIIIDTDELHSLTPSERANLSAAIADGLGMITLFNGPPGEVRGIPALKFRNATYDTAHVRLSGVRKHVFTTWPAAHSSGELVALLKNEKRILSGYTYQGVGKVGFHLLQETYRLSLQGDSAGYSAIWSGLIEGVARMTDTGSDSEVRSRFPYFVDRQVEIEATSSGGETIMSANDIAIPLKESALIDDLWEGTYWPDRRGWNSISFQGDSSGIQLYVAGHGEWSSLTAANKTHDTRKLAASRMGHPQTSMRHTPVAPWLFYILFLTAAAVLWLLPKV